MVLCVLISLTPLSLYAQEDLMIMASAKQESGGSNTVAPGSIETRGIQKELDTLDAQGVSLSPTGTLVNVAFRQVDQKNLNSDVAFVNMSEILEKNYITYPLSDMEAFVGGFNGSLWAQGGYLMIVDGVPRNIGSVMPTEIEQITFLKGVSAVALYGSKAAKGVVMVTTKRGSNRDQMISVRANAGVHLPKSYPEYLGSAEYMTLYNEARANDGLESLYSEEDIYNHASGINPYRYPDVDYYSSDYLRESVSRYDGTVEIVGGNEKARYYTNMGFYTQGTFLNFGEAVDNKDQRFNIRGNVDMELNSFLTARVDAAAIYYAGKGVNANYWGGATSLRPHRFAPLIPISFLEEDDQASWDIVNNSSHLIDGQYLLGGTQLDQTNPIADIYAGGSSTYNSRQFQFNAGVDADLSGILEGLSFNSLFGVDYASTYLLTFTNDYATYEANWTNYAGNDIIGSLTKYGQDASSGNQNISGSAYTNTLSFSGQFNYRKNINGGHGVTATLLANGFQSAYSSEYHKFSNANLGIHLGYNYRNRYTAEFNGALIHSAQLPEDNRRAFSPTFNVGWRISEENFLKGSSIVNNLRLSVQGGIIHTDLDIPGFFLYENIYNQTDGAWYTWKDGLQNQSTDSRRGANPDMTFPKREELSIGLDLSLLDNSIRLNGNVFTSKMTGMVVQNSTLFPSYFTTGFPQSSFIPYVNYNEDQRMGVDFSLNYNQSFGEVDFAMGVSGIWYTTEAAKRAENFEDEYQLRQGKPLDAIWGLESLGFFADQTDIDNSPTQAFGEVQPGDIRYKDQNNDGVVNDQDVVELGRYGSPLTMGINMSAKWKGLTVFVLGTMSSGAHAIKGGDYFWVNGEDKYSAVVRDRWTQETAATAKYPRLTTLSGDNNFRTSDFWMYSTDRFDLARVQISYSFPESIIGADFIQDLTVYVNGANLLTIAPNREILEMNIGNSPQTRFFNLGLRAQF